MLRSLRHISTDSTGWTKKLEKTPDETYVFLWIIVHIINVDISYYVLGKRAEWDKKRERGTQTRYVYGVEEYLKKDFQHFSSLLAKGNAKLCNKLDSHDGFLRVNKVLPDWLDWLCYLAGRSRAATLLLPNPFDPQTSGPQLPLLTICPLGPNWLGTVCPEGPINWGPFVVDQMSGVHMHLGLNVSQALKRHVGCSTPCTFF